MPRLLYGNFDFEHELADRHYNRPQIITRLNAAFAGTLIALAEPGDEIWLPQPLSAGYGDELVRAGLPQVSWRSTAALPTVVRVSPVLLEPWGWSEACLAFARQFHLSVPAVDPDAVRRVNSRGFSVLFERSRNLALPGAAVLRSSRNLKELLSESAAAWNRPPDNHQVVLKAEFGMSGRERLILRGHEARTPAIYGWINRRIEQSGSVYLEPWVERVAEVSTHWHIDVNESRKPLVRFVGRTELLNTSQGQYLASRTGLPPASLVAPFLEELDQIGRDAVAAVAETGYTGPVGIDAMIFRDHQHQFRLRPVQDINARWSMGRLALNLRHRIQPDGYLTLMKSTPQQVSHARRQVGQIPGLTRILPLTPVEPDSGSGSDVFVAVCAETPAALAAGEQQVAGQRTS